VLQKAFVIKIKKKNNMGSAIYAKMFKQTLKYDESKEQDNPDFFKQDEDYMAERKAAKNKKIDPRKKSYQDSVQKLHKPAYKNYLKKQREGYSASDDDGQTVNFIPPQKDPTKIKSLKDYAYTMEIAKGGSVTKDGKTAAQLARENK
jgi:hypothetical protein